MYTGDTGTWTEPTWKWVIPTPPPPPQKLARIFFHSPRCVQVCTAASNLLVGNVPRSSQPDMCKLFSTHIAAGEFDPTGDVLSQLQALDDRQPHPSLDYREVQERITSMLASATSRDNKLRAKGFFPFSSRARAEHVTRSYTGAWQSTATFQEVFQRLALQRDRCAVNACVLTPQRLMFNTMSLDAIIPGWFIRCFNLIVYF